jgi:hypothetical protein
MFRFSGRQDGPATPKAAGRGMSKPARFIALKIDLPYLHPDRPEKDLYPWRPSDTGAIDYVCDATCDECFDSRGPGGDTVHKVSRASTPDFPCLSACVYGNRPIRT